MLSHCQESEATENPEPVWEVLEQDQRTHRFDLKSSTDSTLVSVFTCLHVKLGLRKS